MLSKHYNNYPEWFKTEVEEKLNKRKRLVYVYHDIKPDPDNKGRFIMPSEYKFALNDSVVLPKNSKNDDSFVTVQTVYSTGENPDGTVRIGTDLVFKKKQMCRIVVDVKKPNALAQALFMESTNLNATNPFRQNSVLPLFFQDDPVAKASANRKIRRKKNDAIARANSLPENAINDLLRVIGMDHMISSEIEEKQDEIELYAEKNPDKFFALVDSKTSELEALAKEAKNLGIIKNDEKSKKFVFASDGKLIFSYDGLSKKDIYPMLAEKMLGDKSLTEVIRTKVETI